MGTLITLMQCIPMVFSVVLCMNQICIYCDRTGFAQQGMGARSSGLSARCNADVLLRSVQLLACNML